MVFVLDTSLIEDRLKLKQKYVKNYAKYSFEDTVKNGHTSKSKTVKKVLCYCRKLQEILWRIFIC
jgi:hypothetical protein